MTVLIRDEFTGMADGEDLGGRTPSPTNTPGNTWQQSGANEPEGDGAGQIKMGGNQQSGYIDTGETDMLVEVDFDPGGADNRSAIWVRGSNHDFAGTIDCYFLQWLPGVSGADNLFLRKKIDGGAPQDIASTEVTLGASTARKFGLKVVGTALTCFVDGTQITALDSTDSAIDGTTEGGTRAGMVRTNWASADGRFDNFQVSDVAVGRKIHEYGPDLTTGQNQWELSP